jgi:hypothetical protein
MNKKRWITLGLLAALVFLVAGTASGSVGSPSSNWWVLNGGGAPAAGVAVGSNASFGQPAIGLASGSGVDLSGGFWFGGNNLVYRNPFDANPGSEWQQCTNRSDTAPMGEKFLGQLSNETACLVLAKLPPHRMIKVTFDFYAIRSWNGNQVNQETNPTSVETLPQEPDLIVGPDRWMLVVDDNAAPIIDTTFSNWPTHLQSFPAGYLLGNYPPDTGAAAKNTLGYDYFGTPMDATFHLVVYVEHSSDNLKLSFTASNLQEAWNETWGLDNVEVTLDPTIYHVYLPVTHH